jgi:hypothetical protein
MSVNVTAPVKTTVTRDGVVKRGGEVIGRVEKEMRQGAFATMFGAKLGTGEGTPWWIPFDADGKRLSDGYETRKRAVSMVEKKSQPLAVTDVKVERNWHDVPMVTAWVKFQGHSFGVSRYASESAWVVDFYMGPDAIMPAWSNGTGSRCTSARVLKDEMHTAATDAAIAAGLWPIAE